MKKAKNAVPDEDVKGVVSEEKKPVRSGASVKVLGTIIKPLSENKDKEDTDALADSSLRSPIEALLMHEYAKHEIAEHGTDSDEDIVHSIKHFLHGVQRENCGFLRDKDHFDKDLGVVSSILTDVLPKGNRNLRELIARALFGSRDDYDHPTSIEPPKAYGDSKSFNKDISKEVLNLLK